MRPTPEGVGRIVVDSIYYVSYDSEGVRREWGASSWFERTIPRMIGRSKEGGGAPIWIDITIPGMTI